MPSSSLYTWVVGNYEFEKDRSFSIKKIYSSIIWTSASKQVLNGLTDKKYCTTKFYSLFCITMWSRSVDRQLTPFTKWTKRQTDKQSGQKDKETDKQINKQKT